ncbi:MAG TPA: polymer-forming cytoskeletal protein [Vicinamibacteria bacterium]|nr:polymer-forming cytoskeletal protein [Vicinamibacteria bacterium]
MLKIKGATAEELNGFMDQGTEFDGELRFKNTFRIDGTVKGRIHSDNLLIVGETGQVDAEIDCAVVSIRGVVSGTVKGRERIELLAGSRVNATLVSPRLVIEEGAFFRGHCDMGGGEAGKPARAAGPAEEAAAARDKERG